MQEFLKRSPRIRRVVQIVLVDFGDGKQGVETILAAGIFAAKKFVLANRVVEDFFVPQAAAHFHHGFGDRHDAGIGFAGSRSTVIDGAIGADHSLVGPAGALGRGASVQRLAHALGCREMLPRPILVVTGPGLHRQRGQKNGK